MSTTSARLLAGALLFALPATVLAQTTAAYTPPKLAKPGTLSTPAAGAGDVTVQVFVKKDGTYSSARVIKSSNPADNAAALEMAKTAGYTPAMRDGKKVDAFYDYVLKFAGASDANASGPTAAAYADIRSGKYADAKTKLQAYLQNHPGDAQANTLLGVANAFAGDDDAAVAAFDNVPSIPQQYMTLAAGSYSKHTSNLISAGKYKDAQTSATHLIAMEPNVAEGYYLRGVASGNDGNFQAALPDLQKALDLAKGGKADDKTIGTIEFSLAIAQLNTGAYAAGAATSKDVIRIDPSQQAKLDGAAYVAVANAAIASANAGKTDDAVARLESGAQQFPSSAANFYGQAAFLILADKSPDYKKVKVEADKALVLDPANGRALFANGFVAANAGDSRAAIASITKAKASPLYASDPSFAKQVDDNLKKLQAAGK